jgi:hypothetical protein
LGSFWKLPKEPKFWDLLFLQKQFCLIFEKESVGLHFGRFFSQTNRVTLQWPRGYAYNGGRVVHMYNRINAYVQKNLDNSLVVYIPTYLVLNFFKNVAEMSQCIGQT